MFAAVNGNTVNIFATYSCDMIGSLKGHNGKVHVTSPETDDERVGSKDSDGSEGRLRGSSPVKGSEKLPEC